MPPQAAIGNTAENLRQEFVAGSVQNPYLDIIRSIPRYSDDVERDFGLAIYDQMVNDPDVSAGLETLVNSTLADGVTIIPSIDADITSTDDELAEAEIAKEVCQFVQWAVADMEIPLEDVLIQMLTDGLKNGHKVCEKVVEESVYDGRFAYRLRSLDPKPRDVYRFVVDRNNRLLCLLAIIPGVGLAIPEGVIPDPKGLPNSITPDKFVILTFPGKDRDPRGRSKLRPAYNAWWLKMQTWSQLLQWLVQLAGGFIWAETGENAQADPSLPGTAQDQAAAQIQKMRNGSAVVMSKGGQIHVERPAGTGDQFWTSIDGFGRQILTAILTQSRSNKEAEHGSKADSSAGTDLVDAVVGRTRGVLARTIRKQLFHWIVELNYGPEIAARYTPLLHLAGVPKEDWAANASSAASLMDKITPLQQAEVAAKRLGLTPDLEGLKERAALKVASDKQPLKGETAPANPKALLMLALVRSQIKQRFGR